MGKWGNNNRILYIKGNKNMNYLIKKLNIIYLYIKMYLGRLKPKFNAPEKEKEWYQFFGDNSIEEYCSRLQYMQQQNIRLNNQ